MKQVEPKGFVVITDHDMIAARRVLHLSERHGRG